MPKSNVGGVTISISLDDSKVESQLRETKRNIDSAIQSTSKETRSQIDILASGMGKLGAAMSGLVTVPITAAFTTAIGLAKEYEEAVSKVFTLSDKAAVSNEQLSKDLLDVSTRTGQSASSLADAAYQALSASVETEKVAGFVENAANFARAGFTTTERAVDVLTTIINAYGYAADDANMIAGRLIQTQNKGKTTVDELASSMGQVIPTAAAYNVSLDNLASAYVIMTKQGINTANATTAINGMLNELANQGSDVAAILKDKTGKTFGELMSEGKTLGEVLAILNDHVDGNSEAFANLFSNIRARLGALSLANAGAEEFAAAMQDMADSSTLVGDALEELDTPMWKLEKAKNSLANSLTLLGQELLETLEPAFTAIAEKAEQLYEWFSSLDTEARQTVIKMAAIAAAIGPVITVASKLVKPLSTVYNVLRLFPAAVKGSQAALSGLTFASEKYGSSLATLATNQVKATKVMALGRAGAVGLAAAITILATVAIVKAIKESDRYAKVGTLLTKSLGKTRAAAEDESKAMDNSAASYFNTAAAAKELRDRQEKLAETIKEQNTELAVGVADIDRYRDAINELNGSTNEDDYGRLLAIVNELNDEFGTSYDVSKDAADGYYILADGERVANEELMKLLDTKEQELRLSVYEEQRKQLMEESVRASQEAADALVVLNEKQTAYDQAVAEGAEGQFALKTELDETRAKYEVLARGAEDAAAAENAMSEQVAFVTAAMQDGASSLDKYISTNDTLMTMLQATGTSAQEFSNGMEQMGISVSDLASMNDDELRQMVTAWSENSDEILQTVGELADSTPEEGENAIQGLIDGMENKSGPLYEKCRSIIAEALNTMRAEADAHSPWKTTTKLGEQGAEGLAVGLENGTSEAVTAAENMISEVLSAAQIDDALTNIQWNGARLGMNPTLEGGALSPSSSSTTSNSNSSTVWNIGEITLSADDAQSFAESMRRLAILGAM